MRDRAAAIAPGGIGNIGPGLDVLGMAVSGPGDRVIAERSSTRGVTIASAGHVELPTDAAKNTAGIAASAVLARAGANDVGGSSRDSPSPAGRAVAPPRPSPAPSR
jgi:homoserine kinase